MTLEYTLGTVGKWSHRGLEKSIRVESYLNLGVLDAEVDFMITNGKNGY